MLALPWLSGAMFYLSWTALSFQEEMCLFPGLGLSFSSFYLSVSNTKVSSKIPVPRTVYCELIQVNKVNTFSYYKD